LLKDLAIALSLANLCFFAIWAELLPGSATYYYMKAPPAPINFIVAMGGVLLLGGVIWAIMVVARRVMGPRAVVWGCWSTAVILVVQINVMRRQLPGLSVLSLQERYGAVVVMAAGVVLLLSGLFMLTRFHRRIISFIPHIVLILGVFVVVTFFQGIAAIVQNETRSGTFSDTPFAPRLPVRDVASPRVVWHVFDAMDQRIAFVERPETVRLPELDRLRSHVLYATNAYPPSHSTTLSMPALITGRVITRAVPASPRELMVTFIDGQEPVGWSTQPNVFTRARALGVNSALLGYLHPYCRVLHESLVTCSSYFYWDMARRSDPDLTVAESISGQVAGIVGQLPWAARWQLESRARRLTGLSIDSVEREALMHTYASMLEEAAKAVVNREIGLILLHWPIPHEPGIYDRAKGILSAASDRTYLDNLELVDRTFGQLRSIMEEAGVWENTAILITADHGWRSSAEFDGKTDRRVPFWLRLPGQSQGVMYQRPLCSVLIHDLVLAVLRQEVVSYDSATHWLDHHWLTRHDVHDDPCKPRTSG
jgi:hypothetical protein